MKTSVGSFPSNVPGWTSTSKADSWIRSACCIPKNASSYEAALLYINFLMEPEVALANAEYICYASPNTSVSGNPDYADYGEEILYPDPESLPPTEYFHDIDPEIRSYYEKLWESILLDD